MTRIHLVTLGVLLVWCTTVNGQDAPAETEAANGKRLLAAAYELSQTAQTVDEYGRMIALCEQARATELSESNRRYAKKLMSWAHNRRGEALAQAASELIKQGEVDGVAELERRAMEDFEAAVVNDPTRWKALHNRAVGYAVNEQFDKALQDLDRVVELNPTYANAWFNRGEIRYELGRFAAAVDDYNRAIELRPEDNGAYTGRGHAYYQLRQFTKSLEDYSHALQIKATADAFANRGDAHRSLGHWAEAADDYRAALHHNPTHAKTLQAAAWLMATCPEEKYRNAELAIQAAEKAIRLAGEDYVFLDTLAAAYANAGKFPAALETIQQAIDLAPSKAVARLEARRRLYENDQPYRLVTSTARKPDPAD